MKYLGLGKTIYNSNITELTLGDQYQWTTLLSERLSRKKWSGQWPEIALKKIKACPSDYEGIAENRDITTPRFVEDLYQKKGMFYELLKNKKLDLFCSKFNEDILFIPHHLAHAFSSLALMPFEKALILVMDGGGSSLKEYESSQFKEYGLNTFADNSIEHTSLYEWDGHQLTLLFQEELVYENYSNSSKKFSNGIGSYYEKVAQLIFNDNLSSGKVMGLASFGHSSFKNQDHVTLQRNIDWTKCFSGQDKGLWQKNRNQSYWQDEAATVQEAFEVNLMRVFEKITARSLNHLPLVFTGGCALNCTANFKAYQKKVFPDIYIPPNPGDEGISLGLAFGKAFLDKNITPKKIPYELQTSAFGWNYGNEAHLFKDFYTVPLKDLLLVVSLLKKGEVIAWFQGRSECGPRSLGHRSLLARPDRPGLKDQLNQTIKFRENFRPYGASVLWEESHEYFDVEEGFQNPFMSFATPIRSQYYELLKEVSHVDKTCRMQTVMSQQNPAFHKLITTCQKTGMLPILLNTSLNIMGEPIVESPEDALHFLNHSVVNHLVFNDLLISKVEL